MSEAATLDRITVEPGKCGGKPCIRGVRITVRRVLEILATHPDRDELFRDYPSSRKRICNRPFATQQHRLTTRIKYADNIA
jgi:uncharacterized protein (DUF433 family)